ncbi:Serine hydrolase (FSH1) domain containing protein [Rhypophila sp. PSN 637]
MRFLCLHPWGTSGLIFEKQLATLCSMLGPAHEYVYINGGISCGPARDLPDFVPGPFYSWYEALSSPQCQESHDAISETIEEEGPFDGVIGFSQGASLALSFILHHEIHNPGLPRPFRLALFFCSNAVISPDSNYNADKVAKYSRYYKNPGSAGEIPSVPVADEGDGDDGSDNDDKDQGTDDHPTAKARTKPAKSRSTPKHRALLLLPGKKGALVEELVQLIIDMSNNAPGRGAVTEWPKEHTPGNFPRFMHPLTTRARVPIPTIHVLGRDDPLLRQGELAVRLCDKKKAKVIYFPGSHRIPTAMATLRGITTAFEWAMHQAQLMS